MHSPWVAQRVFHRNLGLRAAAISRGRVIKESDVMEHTSIACHPSSLIANVPGILGFFPNNCVVITTVHIADYAKQRAELGPVLRIGLDSLEHFHDMMDSIESFEYSIMVGYLVLNSETSADESQVKQAKDLLADQRFFRSTEIYACYQVTTLLQGEPMQFLCGEGMPNKSWLHPTVGNIAASPASRSLLDHGMLPALAREELLAKFLKPNPYHQDEASLDELDGACYSRGMALFGELVEDDDYSYAEALEYPKSILRGIMGRQVESITDMVCKELEFIEEFGLWCSMKRHRDALSTLIPDFAPELRGVLMAVAMSTTGEIRANALCIYALAASYEGIPSLVNFALQVVHSEMPEHRLGDLLRMAYQVGHMQETTEQAIETAKAYLEQGF